MKNRYVVLYTTNSGDLHMHYWTTDAKCAQETAERIVGDREVHKAFVLSITNEMGLEECNRKGGLQ